MKTSYMLLAAAMVAGVQVFAGPLDSAWFKGTTDKDPVSYKCGETMNFVIAPQDVGPLADGEWFLNWMRSGDDGLVETGRVAFDGKTPFKYSTKINKPGFVRVQCSVVNKQGAIYKKVFQGDATTPEGKAAMNRFENAPKEVFFDGGAGADIEKLETTGEPADFDAFWAKQFARLDKVPLKVYEKIELPCVKNPMVRLYAVSISCAGLRPVTGYLSVPKAVDQGKTFPARLSTHGYSGDRCNHPAPQWASECEIVLDINAHGLQLPAFGGDDSYTKALRWEVRSHDCIYAFDPKQNADPETAYFNGMVLRVKRGLQYLKTVKGWDGKSLRASGGSQGGMQTIWAAACGEGVTEANSGITWNCDMYTNGKLRKNRELKLAADSWYIEWTPALGYYDAAIWGKRIPKSCFTTISRAGLGDYCCPPTGLAKLWNNMTCPKKVLWYQGSRHGYVPPKADQGGIFTHEVK